MSRLHVGNLGELRVCIDSILDNPIIAIDVETTSLDMIDFEIIGFSAANEDDCFYADFPCLLSQDITKEQIWNELSRLFVFGSIFLAHNAKFDIHAIQVEAKRVLDADLFLQKKNWWCTYIMASLLDENLIGVRVELPQYDQEGNLTFSPVGALTLKALSKTFLDRSQRLYSEDFLEWPLEERVKYGEDDARNCYDLYVYLRKRLEAAKLWDYYVKWCAPVVWAAKEMEENGIHVNIAKLKEIKEEIGERIEVLAEEIKALVPPTVKYKYRCPTKKRDGITRNELIEYLEAKYGPLQTRTESGKVTINAKLLAAAAESKPDDPIWDKCREEIQVEFNPNSGQQVGEYLTSKGYSLPLTRTGKYSTSEDILKDLQRENPTELFFQPYFARKQLSKLSGTYVDGILGVLWLEDESIHPNWNQAGTSTGRFSASKSSAKKNAQLTHKRGIAFQTITRPDTLARRGWPYNPREWFIARPGYVLQVGDLAGAEVRMLAVRSQCPDLIAAVKSGEDMHMSMAERAFGSSSLWKEENLGWIRQASKAIVFGSMYGIGDEKLAVKINSYIPNPEERLSTEEAWELRMNWFQAFPGVSAWIAEESEKILRTGYSTSYLGRRRSPIFLQECPRMTADPTSNEGALQALQVVLWQSAWDVAMRKSRFDEFASQQQLQSRAIRQAINHEIQGSVAEFLNWGLVRLVRSQYRLLAQVHDEIIIEVGDEYDLIAGGHEYLKYLFEREIMGVPFVFDIHTGESWTCGKE